MPRLTLTVPLALLTLVATALPAGACRSAPEVTESRVVAAAQEKQMMPRLRVTKRVTGLSNPWDVKSLGNGRLMITERDSGRLLVVGKGGKRRVGFPSGKVWVSGETGLMSLEVDPFFRNNRRFYTCSGWKVGTGHDVRVIAWRLNRSATRARLLRTLVGGFPTSSGRHGGCRLLIARDGSLYVGTGDAAIGTNPRDLDSLGGKTLRLNRTTGAPWPSNPFVNAKNPRRRYVDTFGHRNVQGLAQRADGSVWSVEHGSYRDDEVNKLVPGGDYGWHPTPGYNEEVPMTDHSLPGRQYAAKWRSGTPTLATSGATFVRGRQWGALNGTLAVAALKASRVVFMTFDRSGKLMKVRSPAALRQYGRLRSVSRADNGDLLITTDTDSGGGAVLRVSPR
ncbi:MAG: PQQ-dependent sugar dehydrogenase [Actinomycetota bacterium]|nr:PQQ-dependent sugar dehydrogenase [Actinomycetota bacterium]